MKLQTPIFIFAAASFISGADWPQFKRSPDRQGCNLTEQVALPAKLCAWVDFGSPIRSSPAIVNGKAYAFASNGMLACIDLASNGVDWHAALGGVGNESSPAVSGGKVYVGTTQGKIFTLDAATGAILNTYDAGGAILAAPLILSTGVYVGSVGGNFHALDLSGNLKWVYPAATYVIHAAASASGQIFFVDGDQNMIWLADNGASYSQVRKIRAYDLSYNSDAAIAFLCPPMIFSGDIYVARGAVEKTSDHSLTRYVFSTGAGKTPIGSNATIRACPSVDTSTGVLFSGSAEAGLEAVGAGWSTPSYWGAYPKGIYGVNSSPAVIGNCVIFGDEAGSVNFFAKTGPADEGNLLWSYKTASGKGICSSPAVSGGKAVIGSMDGMLYGFWNGAAVTQPQVISGSLQNRKASLPHAGEWTLTAYPNPVSGAIISLDISAPAQPMAAALFDIRGALVREWRGIKPGKNILSWDKGDGGGLSIPAGAYFVILRNAQGKISNRFKLNVIH